MAPPPVGSTVASKMQSPGARCRPQDAGDYPRHCPAALDPARGRQSANILGATRGRRRELAMKLVDIYPIYHIYRIYRNFDRGKWLLQQWSWPFFTSRMQSIHRNPRSFRGSDVLKPDSFWLFNIAMGNGPFIDGLPIKNGDFPWLC